MIRKKVLFLIMSIIGLVSLSSCKIGNDYEPDQNKLRVTYNLNGGNIERDGIYKVTHAYDLPEGENGVLLVDPENSEFGIKLSNNNLVIEGWYTERIDVNEDTNIGTVSGKKWDFSTDKMTDDITLYANWITPVTYKYQVIYTNDSNEEEVIKEIKSYVNGKFDGKTYEKKTENGVYYILDGYYSDKELTTVWNNEFKHSESDEDVVVKVYAKYVKADKKYKLVRTKDDLISNRNEDILLLNDIDMEGEEFNILDVYKNKTFNGNGFKISNIKLPFKNDKDSLSSDLSNPDDFKASSVYCSLFKSINNSTIKDVTFENITVDIQNNNPLVTKIYFSPLAGVIQGNSIISNVNITGTYSIETKSGIETEFVDRHNEFACHDIESTVEITNSNINVVKK